MLLVIGWWEPVLQVFYHWLELYYTCHMPAVPGPQGHMGTVLFYASRSDMGGTASATCGSISEQ